MTDRIIKSTVGQSRRVRRNNLRVLRGENKAKRRMKESELRELRKASLPVTVEDAYVGDLVIDAEGERWMISKVDKTSPVIGVTHEDGRTFFDDVTAFRCIARVAVEGREPPADWVIASGEPTIADVCVDADGLPSAEFK